MTKQQLETKTDAVLEQTRDALQLVFDELNQGQQKKILKNEAVVELFDRYGVAYK